MESSKGTLFIVATPIGNLKDISLRALEILSNVDLIAAEDTRRTRKLTTHYNIHKPLVSYHEHCSPTKDEEIISRLKQGENIAVVTDAGTPGLSDPGFRLIKRVIDEGLNLTVIPGPSAILTALLISGFSPVPFAFLGFPPHRGKARRAFFDRYRDIPFTRILFESPFRLIKALEEITDLWGNPLVCVARELTKVFEETVRGSASEVLQTLRERKDGIKGEVTVVVEGTNVEKAGNIRGMTPANAMEDSPTCEDLNSSDSMPGLDALIKKFLCENPSTPPADMAKKIASRSGIPRRRIYERIIELTKKK